MNLTWAKAAWGSVSAFVGTFLVALVPYLQDGATFAQVPTEGWVTAVIAALAIGSATGGIVWRVPNKAVSDG